MPQVVSITTTDTQVIVDSPYNTVVPKKARALGGKWERNRWAFDRRDEERVRDLCMEYYGSDGRTSDLCTIRVTFEPHEDQVCGPISLHGRVIAQAYGRDSGAKLGEDIVCLSGGFTSGGSVKNWRTVPKAGTVVLVRDFPRAEALTYDADSGVTIEPEAPIVDVAGLQAERERITARLAEIDALLGQVPGASEQQPQEGASA